MTAQLDPDALEAAAKAHTANTVRSTYSVTGLPAAIAAYIAAIEPQLREAVKSIQSTSIGLGRDLADEYSPHDRIERRRDIELPQLRAALFALLGLEAE